MSRYDIDIAKDVNEAKQRELLISGYGESGITLKLLQFTDELKFTTVFEDNVPNCSYCDIYSDGTNEFIFAIEEHEGKNTTIYMYKKEGEQYRKVDSTTLEGLGLCHITYIPSNNILVGAFYFSGNIFSLEVTEFGFGDVMVNIYQGKEEGIKGKAHCAYVSKDRKNMYSANIEQDRIYKYIIIDKFIVFDHYIQLVKGTGPRHIVENGDVLYVMTEYSNEVVVIDNSTNLMKVVQRISTLFDGYNKTTYGSTLALSQDKKHLYTANRGANTIAMFAVTPEKMLVEDGYYSTIGKNPRHIALINDDKTLAIMCQDSDKICLYDRDLISGKLTKNSTVIELQKPAFAKDLIV